MPVDYRRLAHRLGGIGSGEPFQQAKVQEGKKDGTWISLWRKVFSGSCVASHTDSQCSWASKNAPEWKQHRLSRKSPWFQPSDMWRWNHESLSPSLALRENTIEFMAVIVSPPRHETQTSPELESTLRSRDGYCFEYSSKKVKKGAGEARSYSLATDLKVVRDLRLCGGGCSLFEDGRCFCHFLDTEKY
jgi:hypothetical protein